MGHQQQPSYFGGMTAKSQQITEQQVDAFLAPYLVQWEYYRQKESLWAFVTDCLVTTNRDAAPGEPRDAAPFPQHPHLQFFASLWYREKRLQVDKSRQLTMTWMECACALHEGVFMEASLIGFQSTGLRNACDKLENYMLYMLKRVPNELMLPWVKVGDDPSKAWIEEMAREFGLSLLPPVPPKATRSQYYGSEAYWMAVKLSNKYTTSYGGEGLEEIHFHPFFDDNKRSIVVVPSGPKGSEKWRGYTFTRAIHDEYAFYENLADTINSAAQTLGQNGFQVLVSTASIGADGDQYPEKMVEKDGVSDNYAAEHGYTPPEGVEIWRTKMRYTHLRIWYYTRPERRTTEWYENNVLTGDMRKNQREILIQYDVPDEDPFYSVYARNPSEYQLTEYSPVDLYGTEGRDVTLVIGQDGGRTPHSVICEVYPNGKVVPTFVVDVVGSVPSLIIPLKGVLDKQYPGWQRRHEVICDPTMFNKSEASDVSAAQLMQEAGFMVIAGNNDTDARFQAVSRLLQDAPFGDEYDDPRFGRSRRLLVAPSASKLHKALSGGSDIDSSAMKNGLNIKNKKSPYSHVMDAFEYVALRVVGFRGRARVAGDPPERFQTRRRIGEARNRYASRSED